MLIYKTFSSKVRLKCKALSWRPHAPKNAIVVDLNISKINNSDYKNMEYENHKKRPSYTNCVVVGTTRTNIS